MAKVRVENCNKLLERDVQRHLDREKHQESIEMLEKKKPWVVSLIMAAFYSRQYS